MRRVKLAFLGAVLLAVAALVVVKVILPRFESEERKILRVVDRAIEAGRERHVANLLALADPSYSDGIISDKKELSDILSYMYLMYKRVSVEVVDPPTAIWSEARPDEGEATLRIRVLLGTSMEAEPKDDTVQTARGTDFWRVRFRKDPESGKWLIVSTASE